MTVENMLRASLERDAAKLGPRLATEAFARGLAVTAAGGHETPIAVTLTPVVVAEKELTRRRRLSGLLARAAVSMARHALQTPPYAALIEGALSPLELAYARQNGAQLETLASMRVDYFVDDAVHALEVNATIPAMQGYSDIAASTMIEVVAEHWGASDAETAALVADNGSNADALWRSLVQCYQRVRPGRPIEEVAILCRRDDAQIPELRYLAARFAAHRVRAEVVHPDEFSSDAEVRVHGRRIDLVYRHIFVRRLEAGLPGSEYVRKLLAEPQGTRAVVLNPPSSQVEVKAVFALLSLALDDAALRNGAGLTAAECEAIAAVVPWTRPLAFPGVRERVTADPDGYVLKRSWDYGGRAVFVGAARTHPEFAARTKQIFGAELDWPGVCEAAMRDARGGGFIAQSRIDVQPQRHLVCASNGPPQQAELFVDYSGYASVGMSPRESDGLAWGGVCRGSGSQVVNILGGGGVLPLLTESVAQRLIKLAK